jgi:glycosyltransferase involved in cell wall biosynthesis
MPMYNAAAMVERSLAPLLRMRDAGEVHEIIVADDGSTDASADTVAAIPGVRLLRSPAQAGPGAARNLAAAQATGTHLWFVDSDVVVAEDAARVILGQLGHERVAALMGSYDDAPAAGNFLSQYKNLVHRYYHQRARREASTFWTGCGVVERALFERLGGFDATCQSLEDIELGYRIRDAGGRILLIRELRGKHLKEWRLLNLLHTEIFRRALPWSRMMLRRGSLTDDLNVGGGERWRAAIAGVCTLLLVATVCGLLPGWMSLAAVGAIVAANLSLVAFFARHRGPIFAAGALLFHQAYYLYSSASFLWAMVEHRLVTTPGASRHADLR